MPDTRSTIQARWEYRASADTSDSNDTSDNDQYSIFAVWGTVWYSLAHANGQNLWPWPRRTCGGPGNHTCKPRRGRALAKEAESWQQVRRYASVS